MKLRLWPRRIGAEPAPEEFTTPEPARPPASEPPPAPEPEAPRPSPPQGSPAHTFPRPHALPDEQPPTPAPAEELPASVSLTLEEAKDAIRAAKGDVIQVGFLAGVYRRHRDDDPRSAETRAARAQLCELIAKRLRDRKLLAPDGTFELRERAEATNGR